MTIWDINVCPKSNQNLHTLKISSLSTNDGTIHIIREGTCSHRSTTLGLFNSMNYETFPLILIILVNRNSNFVYPCYNNSLQDGPKLFVAKLCRSKDVHIIWYKVESNRHRYFFYIHMIVKVLINQVCTSQTPGLCKHTISTLLSYLNGKL